MSETLPIVAAGLWGLALLSCAVAREEASSWSWVSGERSATGFAAVYVLLGPVVIPLILVVWLATSVCAFLWDLFTLVVTGGD